jgi:hypothetical protein
MNLIRGYALNNYICLKLQFCTIEYNRKKEHLQYVLLLKCTESAVNSTLHGIMNLFVKFSHNTTTNKDKRPICTIITSN